MEKFHLNHVVNIHHLNHHVAEFLHDVVELVVNHDVVELVVNHYDVVVEYEVNHVAVHVHVQLVVFRDIEPLSKQSMLLSKLQSIRGNLNYSLITMFW